MKYTEILDRINGLDKKGILMTDGRSKTYRNISLKYKGVRILDLTRPQFEKLKKLGYEWEILVY